jgi:AcrR family transcriptional regulator
MTRRAYDNSHRAEQAELTKQRILEALVELVANGADASTAAIAARAGVSEPTVYRHFPNRDALLAAMGEYANTKSRPTPVASEAAEIGPHAIAMALYMGRNRNWILAGMRHPEYREMRMQGRRKRLADLRKLIEPSVAQLSERDREIAFGAFAVTQRGETWEYLTTTHGLDDEDAGRAVAFILEACFEKLGKLQRQKKTSIVDEAIVKRGREIDEAVGVVKKGRG